MTAVDGSRSVQSQHALLDAAIDYAGLYPPSSLGMPDAARNYLEYALGAEAWALGRFVVPVSRLDELHNVAVELTGADRLTWRLSAVTGGSESDDLLQLQAFLVRNEPRWLLEAIEAKAASVDDIDKLLPFVELDRRLYVELPLTGDLAVLAERVKELGACVKLRTGGVVGDSFPSAVALASALVVCARVAVPFKATAGLHHPLRGEYPLTYALDATSGTMFGYLNVLLASVLARRGGSEHEVVQLLEERDSSAFRMSDDVVGWRDTTFGVEEVRSARSEFIHSFGSCSFREPLDELVLGRA